MSSTDPEAKPANTLHRRTFLALAAGAVATSTSLAVLQGAVEETHRFVVTRHTAILEGLEQPIRVAQWTDLHHGPWIRRQHLEAWVAATLDASPDLIVMTGDLVDRHAGPEAIEVLIKALAGLTAPLGTYAVWGNHDHARFGDLTRFQSLLRGAGVHLLINQGRRVRDDLWLMGIDDLLRGRPHLPSALAGKPPSAASLLLAHNPDVLPRVPQCQVGVTLCGHTHGGQVVLPLLGPPFTSSRYARKFLAGWVQAPARAYVSRGLGVSYVPVRWNCRAELALFDFLPAST